MKSQTKNIIFIVISLVVSILVGFLIKDPIFSSILLFFVIMEAFTSAVGKRSNFIYGSITYGLCAYVSFINHYYGSFMIGAFVCIPLQILGFINWNGKIKENGNVKKRRFTKKLSLIVVIACVSLSLLSGYLLSLIPSQNLAFTDAASNILNICAMILFMFRYSESWIIWLVNNILDLALWIVALISKGPNSLVLLFVSIINLVLNIYSIYIWYKKSKVQKVKLDEILNEGL